MMNAPFFVDGGKLLTREGFQFVLEGELKRAIRSQTALTLIVLEATRGWEGLRVPADDGTLQELAQVVAEQVRGTDVIGHSDRGVLSVVLIDADIEYSTRVIRRLMPQIVNHRFPIVLRIAVGAACYPTHAVDADSLKSQAMSHPISTSCGSACSPTDQN
jgi:GGDEF domain-containing protein